ncbi:MAG: hypothetical protein IIY75_02075 [Erysipelotrichales bacterium]|nr:hypothetical protein [Erysipelotrichales bacterium]
MPFEIHTPPWTNFHDLNLDWMIQKMKELEHKVETSGGEGTTLQALVDDAIADNKTGLEVNLRRTDELSAEVMADLCDAQGWAWDEPYSNLFTWNSSNPGRITVVEGGVYAINIRANVTSGTGAIYLTTYPTEGNPVSVRRGLADSDDFFSTVVTLKAGESVAIQISPEGGSVTTGSTSRWTLLKII